MNLPLKEFQVRRKGLEGFSLTELVVAVAIAMVLMAISMPAFLRAYHSYQLTATASQLADILRLTRYEAIRRNQTISCVIKPTAADPTLTNAFADVDNDGNPGPLEQIMIFGRGGNLVDSGGVPGTSALMAVAQINSAPVAPPPGNTSMPFDSRGAVTSGKVTAFYLANPPAPEAGYRAVLLMPSGAIQIWAGDSTGTWRQLR